MPMDKHIETALARLEAAVASLEKGGAPAGGGDAARRKEIAEIREMVGEAMQLLEANPEGGGA